MRVIIKRSWWLRSPLRPLWAGLLCLLAVGLIGSASLFTYYYVRFSRLIEVRLQGPVFPPASQVYAASEKLRLGQPVGREEVASYLRQAGFSERNDNPRGWYKLLPHEIQIVPGPDSYFAPEPAEISFSGDRITSIVSLNDHFARSEYELEPLLITNLFDRSREKRRLVSFSDLPPSLVKGLLAIEDRRFFQHSGLDYLRILKAAYVDLRSGSARQGASTLTMQLARGLFLTRERTLKRKLAETLVAYQLERRLSKQQIFEYYCNKVYM
ncbi:MAG: transglycosylase domain-containing protein, partial [Acidobacteria bacterium]|nr:transglycosylase domain-containing protein [Acidobacteriota bacterium]